MCRVPSAVNGQQEQAGRHQHATDKGYSGEADEEDYAFHEEHHLAVPRSE